MFLESPKSRLGLWLALGFLFLLGAMGAAGYYVVTRVSPAQFLTYSLVQKELTRQVGADYQNLVADLPEWLGLTQPKTYLLLFLNNTELRPGGGFIGSYAVLRLDKGAAQVLQVEGTESLDRQADRSKLSAPPAVLGAQLGVDRWYFRDSNWSPDFAKSSQQTLALYRAENGVAASDIDAVIGVTTHVLEEIMKRTGPITIQGINFTADNVVEKLEYEVEYGYKDRGVTFRDRKQILGALFHEFVRRLGPDVIGHAAEYGQLVERLAAEKHILAYGVNEQAQAKFATYGWTGQFAPTTTDYVLWADANLAALKTDYAVERTLDYRISRDQNGQWLATVTMQYQNKGKFDWRTTRYRTFSRVYVPAGSQFVAVTGAQSWDKSGKPNQVIIEEQDGHAVFGSFISIEPGETKTLQFTYRLAPQVVRTIENKAYTLSVPKQLGTRAHGLTLELDFGTTITDAQPAESKEQWGDTRYTIVSDLRQDRSFAAQLK